MEEALQTEPEDLSSRKSSLPLLGLSAAIRVRSKRELNLMSAPKSLKENENRAPLSGSGSHDPSCSLEPGEDDRKDSLVSTTGEHEDTVFEDNQEDSHLMDVEEEEEDDEDEDNKGNTSDTGTATTTSTSELTTGISGTVLPGASPPSELVAVTATASASSAVGLHGNSVGGNGGNNLPQLSIANN